MSTGRPPRDGALVEERPGPVEEVLPAEQQAVSLPALRLWLQAQAHLSQTGGLLVLAHLVVDLGDGVSDQSQSVNQSLVLLRVSWKKRNAQPRRSVTTTKRTGRTPKARLALPTFGVLYDALHQDGIFGNALSHQQEALGYSQPSHQRQLTDFLPGQKRLSL